MLRDYMVTYEIDCDPATNSCYEYCEDEMCEEPYYYAYMEKYAATVREQCGPDVTDCESANTCLPEDGDQCTITYCDPASEECAEPIIMQTEEEGGEELETEEIDAEEIKILESIEISTHNEPML